MGFATAPIRLCVDGADGSCARLKGSGSTSNSPNSMDISPSLCDNRVDTKRKRLCLSNELQMNNPDMNAGTKPETTRYPSYVECVMRSLMAAREPLTIEALIADVGRTRPMTKVGRTAIQRAMDGLYQAVPVGSTRVGWLAHLWRGSTIRHSLEADETRRGFVLLDELEHAFFYPEFFQEQAGALTRVLHVELFGGPVIKAIAAAEHEIWALHLDPQFVVWLDEQGAMANDDLIMRADDAFAGRYTVRLQPREIRDEETIDKRNRQLAAAAEEIAAELMHRRGGLYTWELVARLAGSGVFRDPVPADDMHYVLEEYSRLHLVQGVGYELELEEQGSFDSDKQPLTRGQELAQRVASKPVKPARTSPQNSNQRSQALGDSMDLFDFGASTGDEETCDAYEEYLEAHTTAGRKDEPLSHDDFHLLEAELESLVDLELEFGYLLADQQARKGALADRLFIDPETLVDGPWDEGEDLDADSPALWN